jgi:TRAP-type mannitol/chloroaromatic compound transport system permease small subunit
LHAIAAIARWIDRLNDAVGRALSWLALAVVLVCFAVVVLRYVFGVGYVWMQDLYVWLDAVMFTGVAGYTLLKNGHVRVDIFYRPASARRKAWVDLVGFFVFLLPFVAVVGLWSWPYVEQSWQVFEGSRNSGGLPGLFIVKSFLLVFCLLVGLQGLAMAGRSLLVLAGRRDPRSAEEGA